MADSARMDSGIADETHAALAFVAREALHYLETFAEQPVLLPGAGAVAATLGEPFPEQGYGTADTLTLLVERGLTAATRSSGPRFFHWVTGGTTPAALAADWLASALDQNAFSWHGSPLATELEVLSLDWLKDLFGLPPTWGGVLTTGTTMAHVTALGAARHWWGEQQGLDIEARGLAGLPPLPVFSSGYLHPSARKALGLLGLGRDTVRMLAQDATGRLDVAALEAGLRGLHGAPAIVIANAGEVNTGDFDPISTMADLAAEYGAWLHIDGAFGLFARVTPRVAALAAGVERARSVVADGHKWLNVPYDCGFAFVAEPALLARTFTARAAYLTRADDPHPHFGQLGPEQSRRARSLAVWATLRAYGRQGYRQMVEHHLDVAQHLAGQVDAASDLERLAEAPLNIVCFRYRPPGVAEDVLNALNERLGARVLADGRVYVGTTRYRDQVAFRPAIVNWRTTTMDVDLLVEVIRTLGADLAHTCAGR